jgi:hypothetical protein
MHSQSISKFMIMVEKRNLEHILAPTLGLEFTNIHNLILLRQLRGYKGMIELDSDFVFVNPV